MLTMDRAPFSYKSKRHTCFALSICEHKVYSIACATKEGIHLRHFMGGIFDEPFSGTTTIWEDNHIAIA
jgi:hypothetical protein